MSSNLIGCGQLTWRSEDFSPEEVLKQIAASGYDGAPVTDTDPEASRARFSQAGLAPAPGYLGARFWDPSAKDEIISLARDMARTHQALGLTELYVAANLTPERRAVSGHVSAGDALSKEGYGILAATLNAVGSTTQEFAVDVCFHNHVGSYIETRAELDTLFAMVDRSVVFLGPDFGHLEWAGDDSVALIRDYADLIKTVHIKDINPIVRAEGVANAWGYQAFSEAGIFTELGTGYVDIPGIVQELNRTGFGGWIIVETDVTQLSTALESAQVSRAYLTRLGL